MEGAVRRAMSLKTIEIIQAPERVMTTPVVVVLRITGVGTKRLGPAQAAIASRAFHLEERGPLKVHIGGAGWIPVAGGLVGVPLVIIECSERGEGGVH